MPCFNLRIFTLYRKYGKYARIKLVKNQVFIILEWSFLIRKCQRWVTSLDYEKNCVRTIYSIDISTENDIIYIDFVGNGFLKYMVRNMVGLLIEVGSNNRSVEDVKKILDSKDRKEAGICAPSMGLYLANVYYC